MSAYDPDTLAVGVLGKPHGLAGELLLRPYNAAGDLEWLEGGDVESLILEREGRRSTARVRSVRASGTLLRIAFEGVTTPEQARALTLSVVRVPRTKLPALGPGEYYVEDVPGCQVVNAEGQLLGTVRETFWNGAQDVMVVDVAPPPVAPAPGERLIPMVPDYIQSVDAPARRIVVTWDEPHE